MINWFINKKDELLVAALTEQIERRLPPSVAKSRSKNLNIDRIGDLFEQILSQALDYKRKESPNFFRRARIANLFKWSLKNLGYAEEFCDAITKSLVIYMSKK